MISDLMNLDAEQAVLGTLMTDKDLTLWASASRLRPEHFAEPLHARIFEAAAALIAKGAPASPLSLQPFLAKNSALRENGGNRYLGQMTASALAPADFRHAVESLWDLAARRAIVDASSTIVAKAKTVTVGESFRPALARHIETLQGLFDRGGGRKTVSTLGEGVKALTGRIERIRRGEPDTNAIPTGIASLDRATGGLHRGEFVILGARPSMGKTALALQVAYNVARAGGGVLYFSLEMPRDLLVPRLASTHLWTPGGACNVPYSRILRGEISDRESEWVARIGPEVSSWPFVIDDAAGLSAVELESRAQVAKARLEREGHGLSMIVVDHLHKMRAPEAKSKVAEYTEISARLAEMAKRLDVPVLCLAQLNRGVEGRDDKRPQLSDLRESGSIEQDADVAMFLYRQSYYLERTRHSDISRESDRLAALGECRNRLDVIIEKQRSGAIGTVELHCDIAHNAVVDPQDLRALPAGGVK